MQYVWQFRLIPSIKLSTVDGRRISIINPGMINSDSGPDFFNADIKIDGQQWIGNVEIHVRASDWFRHGHDKDPAYDSVILHVVEYDDAPVFRTNGQRIPQMELKCEPNLNAHFNALVSSSPVQLPCGMQIKSIPNVYISDWIDSLAIQRLQDKAEALTTLTKNLNGDWASGIYTFIARALGFGKNADPFERLARSTPLKYLRHHTDNITAIESMLFGQAGMLGLSYPDNEYYRQLQRDYDFYRQKFNLTKPNSLGWKMSKLRPQNFPHRRIAYLAALVANGIASPYGYHRDDTLQTIREKIDLQLTGYWSRHYTFSSETAPFAIQMSRASLDLILINAIIPTLYAWGTYTNEQWMIDQAIDYLHEMKPENNMLVRLFTDLGIKCPDAFTSQGIIQLRRKYCEQRQCLNCRLGHRILTDAAIRY